MAGKPKKPKIEFTLENIIEGAQELSFACEQLKSAVKLLTTATDVIKKLPASKQLDVLSRMDSRHVSLYLVTMLTLDGVDTLRMANNLVPAEFVDGHFGVISRIVRQHCDLTGISEDDCLVACKISMQKLGGYFCTVQGSSDAAYTATFKQLETDTGLPHQHFLCPPTSACLEPDCSRFGLHEGLSLHHKPVSVAHYGLKGIQTCTKVSLRCGACKTVYNYDKFGNKVGRGERHYLQPRDAVEGSDVAYLDRQLHKLFLSLCNHCWTSFQGLAEAFNDVYAPQADNGARILSRKVISDAFFNAEVESDIRENALIDTWRFTTNSDREVYMRKCEESRVTKLYEHGQCSEAGLERGCGNCWVLDGNWKLAFAHCMFAVECTVEGLKVSYPNVCPEEPKGVMAFCAKHCLVAEERGIPTKLKEFLKFCGLGDNVTAIEDPSSYISSLDDRLLSETVLKSAVDVNVGVPSSARSQGTAELLHHHPHLANSDEDEELVTICNKDTGEKCRLRMWSRGHLFIVRSCGHIDTWKPLYKSESPSQVFLITIEWLYQVLRNKHVEEWQNVILAYDNMCHLDGLRVAAKELPLPPPYSEMWLSITKIIDSLHIRNHKDPRCIARYDPKKVKESRPKLNTMAAEQTFVWASRYKKIVCSMGKTHHLFFLHRMVKERNRYNEQCRKAGREPLLPKAASRSH